MIDIENARELVERARRRASSGVQPIFNGEVADTIASLLNEVERLNSPVVLSEWQKLVAERDALKQLMHDEIDENTRLRVLGGAAADENITTMIERVIAERGSFEALWRSTMDVLEAERAERDALAREVDACAAALPGPYYMDPPDGGDVSISEQLRRMARDAARYRWLRQPNPLHREAHIAVLTHNGGWVASGERADAAIDAAMKGASDEL